MEGTFDFDASGVARVIAAPNWSRAALEFVQRGLTDAAEVLSDQTRDSTSAFAALDDRLAQMEADARGRDQLIEDLIEEVRGLRKQLSRPRLLVALRGILDAIGDFNNLLQFGTNMAAAAAWIIQGANPGEWPLGDTPPQGG
jgi:hypothetical protein